LAADGEGRHIRMRPEREPWREKWVGACGNNPASDDL
jgi:hypothetical protein